MTFCIYFNILQPFKNQRTLKLKTKKKVIASAQASKLPYLLQFQVEDTYTAIRQQHNNIILMRFR